MKKPIQLNKFYKNEDKFGIMGDNFIFKLIVCYDKSQVISLPLEAYFEDVSIILTSQVQTYFYANQDFTVSFKDFW